MEHRTEIRPDPWRFALEQVQAGREVVLVKVVDHSGSVPGVTGAMVTVANDRFAGTIGGGAAEQQLVERARAHVGAAEIFEFRHTPGEGGTLCSGLQVFALITLSEHHRHMLQSVVDTLAHHRHGTLRIDPPDVEFIPGIAEDTAFESGGEVWRFREPLGLLDSLTLVGGGHVSLAVSKVMATLPYRIRILDNRADLETVEANIWAHETRVVDYDRVAEYVPDGDRSWVVVMTYGHEHDRQVLERLLGRRYAYLGVLGSKAKIRKMFADMETEGASPEELARVRAPVGLPIGSHTPEEIAVSIAGQIIAIRNGKDTPCPPSSSR